MSYRILFTKQAAKDLETIAKSSLKSKAARLLQVLENDPFELPYEKLVGDLSGAFSRRINVQHRLVYRVDEDAKTVVVLRMWTHYGD